MKSRWFHLKEKALEMRRSGLSIKTIESRFGIPRSTLSGWFKSITLSDDQQNKLRQDWMNSLSVARKKAVKWHNTQKKNRILLAKQEALKTLSQLDYTNPATVEIALAMLYLGEGSKKTSGTALGSSDPMILKFFIGALKTVYQADTSKIRAELYLRADQDINTTKQYWSKELGLSFENFTYANIDTRTHGSKTYPTYKGVCLLRCGRTDIQRRLMFLSEFFCKKMIEHSLGS